MRQSSTRPRAHLYSPMPRRGRAMLNGARGFSTGNLPSPPMMRVTQLPLSADSSLSVGPPSSSFSEVTADPLGGIPGGSGRYSPDMHHSYDVADLAGELGVQKTAPPLSASPEPMWSSYGGYLSDDSIVSSPQSTLFSTFSPAYSPASSPDIEANYICSSAPDTLHAFGSVASIPRSMTYPPYSAHPSDAPSYWNTGSGSGFQG